MNLQIQKRLVSSAFLFELIFYSVACVKVLFGLCDRDPMRNEEQTIRAQATNDDVTHFATGICI